jgi:hypothetical protein
VQLYPYLKGNVEALEGTPIYDWLFRQKYDLERLSEQVVENRFGLLDWKLEEGGSVFEKMPPKNYYAHWIPEKQPDTSCTVIIGSNLGYGINHVLANTPQTHKILVLEPRPDVLMACLGQTDYRPFFEMKKLHFMPPDVEFVTRAIQHLDLQFLNGNIYVRSDTPSQQIGPEYAKWTRIINEKLENFSVEMITLRNRQDLMVGNELKNFARAAGHGSLKPLKDAAKGLTAVVIGAGPSLSEFAPTLAENPGGAIYATAIQTLPVCQRLGVKPHFCVGIDYSGGMRKIFEQLDPDFASDIPLIYSTKMDPEVVETYPGPKLPLWTMGGLTTYVMGDRELVLDAGGNVGLAMTRLLAYCGVSRTVFVGQDFAAKGATHAAGHHQENVKASNSTSFRVELTNRDGETIWSSPQFMAAKRDLEGDLAQSPFEAYNLYGGGVSIAGTREIGLGELDEMGLLACPPGLRDDFIAQLNECRGLPFQVAFQPKSHLWASQLRKAEKQLEKLFKKLSRNQEPINEIVRKIETFVKSEPVYVPYLFNEVMDLAGLSRARYEYVQGDLGEIKSVIKRINTKIREMDRCLCADKAA